MGGMELGVWRCGGGTRRSWERGNSDHNVLYEKTVFNKNINSILPFHFVDISVHMQLTHHGEYNTTLKWGIFSATTETAKTKDIVSLPGSCNLVE